MLAIILLYSSESNGAIFFYCYGLIFIGNHVMPREVLNLHVIYLFQVRKRPLNKKELSRKEEDIVTVFDNAYLAVHEPKLKVPFFVFFFFFF